MTVYEFDRYINGVLMAEGVTVSRARSFSEAMKNAVRLASRGPNGEAPVLVFKSQSSSTWAVDQWPLDTENAAYLLQTSVGTDSEWIGITTPPDENGDYEHVAYCHPDNAPLIAAAPQLLEALIHARNQIQHPDQMIDEAIALVENWRVV